MRPAVFALVVAFCVPVSVCAQGADSPTRSDDPADAVDTPNTPLLRVDFPETEAIPGQFLTLRLTVLVPSYMPAPPVWPSFETPNLLVRVPEGATNPTSERIDGETWSGISRRYSISPMVPGAFELPPEDVVVTWADPDADQPVRVTLPTNSLAFTGVLPAGAEALDPFIAASDLDLRQEITGEPGAMTPGDSVTRTVTVEVAGVSPMFLPNLLAPVSVPGVAAYPDAPRLDETDDRGTLGGTRIESVTYVAESGGAGTLPEITLDWFDIDTGKVVSARAEAVDISVDGPPAALADPESRRQIMVLAAAGVGCLILLAIALRLALPPLRRKLAAHRAAQVASEDHAWRELSETVKRQDLGALYPALDIWAARVNGADPRHDPGVQSALATLGRARYGARMKTEADPRDGWNHLDTALRTARRAETAPTARRALPPLNPGATA